MLHLSKKTSKNVQPLEWVGVGATALIIIGVGMNIVVTQTLGSFSAASVLLALYLAFWAFVLGSIALIGVSIRLFIKRKFLFPEGKSLKLEDHEFGALTVHKPSRRRDDRRDLISPTKAA
ncbi:MAG TPA: hypothetical protein VKB81_18560 [Nitrospira sp.]|nr:hypothetical protein [Nitrospira sp.]